MANYENYEKKERKTDTHFVKNRSKLCEKQKNYVDNGRNP